MVLCLKSEGCTSSADNSRLDGGSLEQVGDLVGGLGESTLLSSVLSTTEVVARLDGEARVGGVESLLGSREDVVLDEELGTLACVDAVRDVLVVVVEEMAGAEAERWAAGVDVLPVVKSVGDSEVTLVLGAVGVGVANERTLPVVVEVGVGDGDVVCSVGNIKETVVVVLAVVHIGGELDVVNPDVLGELDGNGVSADNLLHDQVTDDDVLDVLDGKGEVGED